MAEEVDVHYNNEFKSKMIDGNPIISTMPMPMLMKILSYDEIINFTWTSGATLKAKIQDCDAYVSLLVPDPEYDFSRLSITGDELFIELGKQASGLATSLQSSRHSSPSFL